MATQLRGTKKILSITLVPDPPDLLLLLWKMVMHGAVCFFLFFVHFISSIRLSSLYPVPWPARVHARYASHTGQPAGCQRALAQTLPT